jgi:Carboxypeptidase regulatory-like domain
MAGAGHRTRLLVLGTAAALAAATLAGAAAGQTAAQPQQLGAPPTGLIQTELGHFSLNGHLFRPGQTIVAKAQIYFKTCFRAPAPCVSSITWPVQAGSSCRTTLPGHAAVGTLVCRWKAAATDGWQVASVNFNNVTGTPANGQDYYAVISRSQAVIQGHVLDKDKNGVAGISVSAFGSAGKATGTTGDDGYYALDVAPDSYRVVPENAPKVKSGPAYLPAYVPVSVQAGGQAKADFTLRGGLQLELQLDRSSVAADGMQVVSGSVVTTEFGKAKPNIAVRLQAMPGESAEDAVTSAPRAAICQSTNRIWPTGTVSDPDGSPVTVTTDGTGHYDFTITVGTKPGSWTLDAWAFGSDGKLSTDVASASDTKTIAFTPLGSATVGSFVDEFDRLHGTTLVDQITNSSPTIAAILSQIAASGVTKGVKLGGLSYSLANAADGQVVLIAPASSPPSFTAAGAVSAQGSTGDLVIDSAEWTGAGLASTVTNAASFSSVVQQGLLKTLPSFGEWSSGGRVPGWSLKKNAMSPSSASLEYFGWAYPGIATPGACY